MVKCEIIQDLLPLYVDNVCSDSSREMIEEHIRTCESCREKLEKSSSEVKLEFSGLEAAKVKTLKNFKRKIFRKNVLVAAISCLVAAGLLLGTWAYAFGYDKPIPYKEGSIKIVKHEINTVQNNDGSLTIITNGNSNPDQRTVSREVLDATYLNDDYYKSISTDRTVERNGEKVKVIYIFLTDTLATRLSKQNDGERFSRIAEPEANAKYDRIEVYYLVADYNIFFGMTDKEFDSYRTNGNLIWSGTLE